MTTRAAKRAATTTRSDDVESDLGKMLIAAWRTNSRVTAFLVEHIPAVLWTARVPASPRRTIGSIAAHLHNSRSQWIRTLGREHGLVAPELVDLRTVGRRDLLAALARSSVGMESLLELGLENSGRIPPSKGYVWRNLPLDVGHVLAYFAAHEGHHRGQIVMLARQLGQGLPREAIDGLWQFTTRTREVRG
jgi:uncharacterized damage-inducible protein DinB